MEEIAHELSTIRDKTNAIDINGISRAYFESKILEDLNYLKNPEKIEILEAFYNELKNIFKIFCTKTFNFPSIDMLESIFMNLKFSTVKKTNLLNATLEAFYLIMANTDIQIPLVLSNKALKLKNINSGTFQKENIDKLLKKENDKRELFFKNLENCLLDFIDGGHKMLLKTSKAKTKEFYSYLVTDFQERVNQELSYGANDIDEAQNFNINKYRIFKIKKFNIFEFFKSTVHQEAKISYDANLPREIKKINQSFINEDKAQQGIIR